MSDDKPFLCTAPGCGQVSFDHRCFINLTVQMNMTGSTFPRPPKKYIYIDIHRYIHWKLVTFSLT